MAGDILVVDDDAHIRDVICFTLQNAGMATRAVANGNAALDAIGVNAPDLMILDVGMPEMDGFEVCRAVRRDSELPILFLTARDDEVDRVVGLELGGDDYVTKPFSPRELVARVKAILKRAQPVEKPDVVVAWNDLELDSERHLCRFGGTDVSLTASEFSILATLMQRPEVVLDPRSDHGCGLRALDPRGRAHAGQPYPQHPQETGRGRLRGRDRDPARGGPETGRVQPRVRRKWRPSLALLISAVLGLVLCLSTAGLFLFQFYTHQLIQQTEESLLAQATVLAEVYVDAYVEGDDGVERGVPVPAAPRGDDPYDPINPNLSLAQANIPPPRSDAQPAPRVPDPIYAPIGARLTRIAERAQLRNLAGYRALDPNGTVIGGTGEVGLSLAHVPEIQRALAGEVVSLLRHREREGPLPPLYSVSRGTKVRVFVAMPVIVQERVVGAVYLSRTPNNIVKYLYAQRVNLVLAGLAVLICTAMIGILFWRFVSRPLRGLIRAGGCDRGR